MPLSLDNLRAATPLPINHDPTKPYFSESTEQPTDDTAEDSWTSTRAGARTVDEPPDQTKPDTSTRAGVHARNGRIIPGAALDWCIVHYESRHGGFPVKGRRNAWLTALTFFCNEKGVPLNELESYAAGYAGPEFTIAEINRTVRGIYQREAAHHNSKPWEPPELHATEAEYNTDGHSSREPDPVALTMPLNTPTVPAEAYQLLPDFLQQCCQPLPTDREQDVLLTGTLAVLSGCFPTLEGRYRGKVIGANVYAFVVAPAASGKGALDWARRLAWPQHLALREASQREREAYELQLYRSTSNRNAPSKRAGRCLRSL
jgi:hypothetical protein